MSYRYETHLHTVEGSACGVSHGEEYIEVYQRMGYAGIFITDHFYRGNTRPDRNLSWEDWVNEYVRGYERAKAEGDRVGFSVFFGIEEKFDDDEYLIYGVDKAWLLSHPEIRSMTQQEMFQLVGQSGGLMIQAHPFRDRGYVRKIYLGKNCCHGIEAVNSANQPGEDKMALAYAEKFGLLCQAGSDTHKTGNVRDGLGSVTFETPLISEQDYVERMLHGEKPKLIYDTVRVENGLPDLKKEVLMLEDDWKKVEHETVYSWMEEKR